MTITAIHTHPATPRHEGDDLLAYCRVVFGGVLAIEGIRLVARPDGPYLAMPERRAADGRRYRAAYPVAREFRAELTAAVMEEYRAVMAGRECLAMEGGGA